MTSFRKTLIAALAAVTLLSSTNVFSNTNIQGQRFRDWSGICEAVPQRPPICYLEQTIAQAGNAILRGIIGYAPNKPYPTVFFELPPGINIRDGVSLSVDRKKPIRFNGRCTQFMCSAGFVLNPPMMAQFRKGSRAVISYSPAPARHPSAYRCH